MRLHGAQEIRPVLYSKTMNGNLAVSTDLLPRLPKRLMRCVNGKCDISACPRSSKSRSELLVVVRRVPGQ